MGVGRVWTRRASGWTTAPTRNARFRSRGIEQKVTRNADPMTAT
jgi:hypothetical protein